MFTNAMIDEFYTGLVEAMLWAECDPEDIEGETFLDANYTEASLSREARARLYDECRRFLYAAMQHKSPLNRPQLLPSERLREAGRDFWFTRQGHGTGFWCRPNFYGDEAADVLTTMARCFPTLAVQTDGGVINVYY